jgi:autotransporter-associated beta strand protein
LQAANPYALGTGAITFAGGNLQYGGSNTTDYSSRFSTADGQAYNIDTNGLNVTFASALASNDGALQKFGDGTLTLTATNAALSSAGIFGGALAISNDDAVGSGALTFNGGSLYATGGQFTLVNQVFANQSFSLSGISFSSTVTLGNDITISLDNGASPVNTDSVFSGPIQGTNAITIAAGSQGGTGAIVFGGSNSYTGGTWVTGGKLVAANANALGTGAITVTGGTYMVDAGANPGNQVFLNGGAYERAFHNGDNLAGAMNATSTLGAATTSAIVLAGTSSGATIVTSFSATSGASNDSVRLSDAYSFQGTGTGVFSLELSVTDTGTTFALGWLNPNTNLWVNAINGNTGNDASAAQMGFDGDFTAFQSIYGSNLSQYVGAWGTAVESGTDIAWAVIDHNSEFSVASVPEPSVVALLLTAFTALVLLCRHHPSSRPAA